MSPLIDYTLTASQMRDLLKARSHLLVAGLTITHPAVSVVWHFRQHYINEYGLPTYLSQMLGPLGTTPMSQCGLYFVGEYLYQPREIYEGETVQRFILRHFSPDYLPYKVLVRGEDGVKVRYI